MVLYRRQVAGSIPAVIPSTQKKLKKGISHVQESEKSPTKTKITMRVTFHYKVTPTPRKSAGKNGYWESHRGSRHSRRHLSDLVWESVVELAFRESSV